MIVKNQKGFTLLELLVVIAAIGILMTVSLISYGRAQGAARDANRKADLAQYRFAFEKYFQANGNYPLGGEGVSPYEDQSGPTSSGIFTDGGIMVSGGFITTVLRDPINKVTDLGCLCYTYISDFTGTNYVLYARLEASEDIYWVQRDGGEVAGEAEEPTEP